MLAEFGHGMTLHLRALRSESVGRIGEERRTGSTGSTSVKRTQGRIDTFDSQRTEKAGTDAQAPG